jgi:SAM-dependent methyltransferase
VPGSDLAGFELWLSLADWRPGRVKLAVVAEDEDGNRTETSGLIQLVPFRPCPASLGQTTEEVRSGRIVMGVDEPRPELRAAGEPVSIPVRVEGWAWAAGGVESVAVYVDGTLRVDALHGLARLPSPALPEVGGAIGFTTTLDQRECGVGEHVLTVVATATDGDAIGATIPIFAAEDAGDSGEAPAALISGREHYLPETDHGKSMEPEHHARYRWAAAAASGCDVLDAACGSGFGTLMLAEAGARTVTGVDLDPLAVETATERVGDAAEIRHADVRSLPFADDSFDLVVCFETIEHLPNPDRALDELRRVLRADGLLLVSSPNRGVYPSGNPFHLHEYTPDELELALRRRFRHVSRYAQQTYVTSLVTSLAQAAAASPTDELGISLRKLVAQAPGEELYTLAAASDVLLPELPGAASLGTALDVKTYIEQAQRWEQRAVLAEADAASYRVEAGMAELERDRIASQLQELREAREREVQELRDWLGIVHASASWRVTAPLRRLSRALGRARRRP